MTDYVITDKLNAMEQLMLARKLGPALPLVDGLVRKENESKDKTLLVVLLLGNLSDADSDYVIKKCLSVVSRRQLDGTFAKVTNASGLVMFDDMGMNEILIAVDQVIEANLGDFMRTALSGLDQ